MNPYDVFYDLGSGVGKLVLYMALSNLCAKAVGLEIGERRHFDACVAWKRLIKNRARAGETLSCVVDFQQKDISREK